MSKFKVGDRVSYLGNIGVIGCIHGDRAYMSECISSVGSHFHRGDGGTCTEHGHFMGFGFYGLTLIEESKLTKNMTTIKEKFVTALLPEPEKSFRKAGITNGDGLLTEEGQTIFLTWLLNQNKDAFNKEVVQALLKESEDK